MYLNVCAALQCCLLLLRMGVYRGGDYRWLWTSGKELPHVSETSMGANASSHGISSIDDRNGQLDS